MFCRCQTRHESRSRGNEHKAPKARHDVTLRPRPRVLPRRHRDTEKRVERRDRKARREKRAKSATMSRCDRVHEFCHGDTKTLRSGAHAARRTTRRTQAGAAGLLSGQTDGRKRKPIALGVCVSARPHARAAAMRRRATRCQLCVSVSLARIFFVRLRDLRAFVVSLVPRSISRRNRASTNLTAPAHYRKLHGCPPFMPREKTCRARSASSCV